jgi:hypothetical protein
MVFVLFYFVFNTVSFGIFDIPSSSSRSAIACGFNQIIDINKNLKVDPTHFQVSRGTKFLACPLSRIQGRILNIDINSLSIDRAPAIIFFESHKQIFAQADISLTLGKNYFAIPNKEYIDAFNIVSTTDANFTIGINSATVSRFIPFNKRIALESLAGTLLFFNMRRFRARLPKIAFFYQFKVSIFDFLKFLNEHRKGVAVSIFIASGAYGYFLTHFTLSIDDEIKIAGPKDFGWIGYGRYGIYFLDKLLVNQRFTPFLTNFLAVVILVLVSFLMYYVLSTKRSVNWHGNFKLALFSGIFISFPFVNCDFMSFTIFNLWLGIGFFVTVMSFWIVSNKFEGNDVSRFAIGSLILSIGLSIYQSYISVFVLLILSSTALELLGSGSRYKRFWSLIRLQFATLISAIMIYEVLNWYFQKTITPAYGYINSLIGWGKGQSAFDCILAVLHSYLRVLDGRGLSSNLVLLPSLLLLCYVGVAKILELKNLRDKIGIGVLFIFLPPSSILLELALGAELPARSLLGLPTFLAITWLIIFDFFPTHLNKSFLYAVSTVFLLIQLQTMNNVFYGNDLRFQNDKVIAYSIIQSIESKGFDVHKNQVVFVGALKQDENKYYSPKTSGGISFFADESQPYRMVYFLNSLGMQIAPPTEKYYQIARGASVDLPSWPLPQSITLREGLIIVKLSNPSKV